MENAPRLIVVMGVAGSGKTTIGKGLAEALDAQFVDADDCHPKSNIEKMSRGAALSDDDRWPWLHNFAQVLAAADGRVIGACSALKRAYREKITAAAGEPVLFLFLNGSRALVAERLAARMDHFMPAILLDSQFSALEVPGPEEPAVSVDMSGSSEEIVAAIVADLTRKAS
jgi:gluconokinase